MDFVYAAPNTERASADGGVPVECARCMDALRVRQGACVGLLALRLRPCATWCNAMAFWFKVCALGAAQARGLLWHV